MRIYGLFNAPCRSLACTVKRVEWNKAVLCTVSRVCGCGSVICTYVSVVSVQ